MRSTSAGGHTPAIRYRWSWPHVPDAPEIRGQAPLVLLSVYGLVIAAFALPVVQRATHISVRAIATIVGAHAAWVLLVKLVVARNLHRTSRVFDAIVIGNALSTTALACAIPVLGGSPDTVLWGAVVLYATMNGALFDFAPSVGLQAIHVGVPLATVPMFRLAGHEDWSIAGPVLAAFFAALGYHLTAFNFAEARANRRAVEQRLAAAERVAHELRLARDLHDVVGSTLGTVKLYADLLAGATPIATPLSAVAQHGLDDLRAVLDALAPPEGVGLESTVEAIARRTTPPDVRVTIAGDWPNDVAGATRMAVARIVQEAMYNAVRHGKASNIEISAIRRRRALDVIVRDDGCGFDPDVAAGTGRGLAAMSQRAGELGGWLAIQSRPGAGTTITASFALGTGRIAA